MIDNFIKGPATTIAGFLFMIAAMVGWFIEYLTDAQAIAAGVVGFALLFMRDQLPGFISKWVNKKIDK